MFLSVFNRRSQISRPQKIDNPDDSTRKSTSSSDSSSDDDDDDDSEKASSSEEKLSARPSVSSPSARTPL